MEHQDMPLVWNEPLHLSNVQRSDVYSENNLSVQDSSKRSKLFASSPVLAMRVGFSYFVGDGEVSAEPVFIGLVRVK